MNPLCDYCRIRPSGTIRTGEVIVTEFKSVCTRIERTAIHDYPGDEDSDYEDDAYITRTNEIDYEIVIKLTDFTKENGTCEHRLCCRCNDEYCHTISIHGCPICKLPPKINMIDIHNYIMEKKLENGTITEKMFHYFKNIVDYDDEQIEDEDIRHKCDFCNRLFEYNDNFITPNISGSDCEHIFCRGCRFPRVPNCHLCGKDKREYNRVVIGQPFNLEMHRIINDDENPDVEDHRVIAADHPDSDDEDHRIVPADYQDLDDEDDENNRPAHI
jgi:hypothetical protein